MAFAGAGSGLFAIQAGLHKAGIVPKNPILGRRGK